MHAAHHPEVTRSLIDLASLYDRQGKYADPLYQRIITNVGDKSDLHAADTLFALGKHYCYKQEQMKGLPLCERSLAIRESILGDEHPALIPTIDKLITQYLYEQKYDMHMLMSQRLVKIQKKAAGADSVEYANSLTLLGESFALLERDDEAEAVYKQAVEILEKILGRDHYDVSSLLRSMGAICLRSERYEEAIAYFERHIEILGSESKPLMMPFLHGALGLISDIYLKVDRFEEAEASCRRMLEMQESNPEVYAQLKAAVLAKLDKIARAKSERG